VVERLVILQPLGYDHDRLRLIGPDGQPVPCVIRHRRFLQRFWGIDYRGELYAADQRARLQAYLDTFADRILRPDSEQDAELVDTFLEIQFLARDLPACGHAVYELTDRAPDAPSQPLRPVDLVRADGPVLENHRLRVTLHTDGTLDLVDKQTGLEWNGLGLLEDTEDAGDEYDWSPCPRSRTLTSADLAGEVSVVEDTGLAATLEARFTWPLPRALGADRQGRTEETVDMPVTVRARLTAADEVVDLTITIDNRACDHRLRAVFPTGIKAETMVSDGQFILAERPLDPPRGDDWVQPHPGTYPQQGFSYVADAGGRGLAVLVDGLPEVAPRRQGDGTATLLVTLLRCVGWLSRDDFPTRKFTNAGPTIPTPEAQELGEHTLRLGLAPLAHGPRDLRRRERQWRRPSLTRQGVAAGAVTGSWLLAHDDPEVDVSAIRRHPERGTLIVRLWNQTDQPRTDTLRTARPIAAAWRCDLLDARQDVHPVADPPAPEVAVELAPHRIVTLEIAFCEEAAR
jgi:alpha-mannosidase